MAGAAKNASISTPLSDPALAINITRTNRIVRNKVQHFAFSALPAPLALIYPHC